MPKLSNRLFRRPSCRPSGSGSGRRRLRLESLESRRLLAGGSLAVGTNLPEIADFKAVAFVDVMNQSRRFRTATAIDSGPYNTGKADLIPLDANGWPLESPFDPGDGSPPQIVHTVVPVHGAGTYIFVGQGTGKLQIRASGGLVDPTSRFFRTVEVDFTGGAQTVALEIYDTRWGDGTGDLFLYFVESDPADPIRDLDLVAPGALDSYLTEPFMDSYTDDLASFGNLRFMDWLSTNNNPVQEWSDRTTPEMVTQTVDEGVSLEHVVALANQTMQDPWINVPAQANDEYVQNMARLLADHLDPSLKIFVEYSNETWNGIFSQSGYVRDAGLAMGLETNPYRAAQRFHALRSAQVWTMFDAALGESSADRLVKVMATQMVSENLTNQRLDALADPEINPTGIMPDALAVNAYFGSSIADELVTEGVVDSIDVSEILSRLDQDRRERMDVDLKAQKSIADEHDLWLITYEGGQHLVGAFGNENNQALTDLLIAANRDPWMYEIYWDYLNQLSDNGVTLHSNFTYVYEPSKFGSWGLKETQDQPIEEAHKFRAVQEWVEANPAQNQLPRVRLDGETELVDDGSGFQTVTLDASRSRDFDGAIVQATWTRFDEVLGEVVLGTGPTIDVDVAVGTEVITLSLLDDDGGVSIQPITIQVAPLSSTGLLVEADFSAPASPAGRWDQTTEMDAGLLYSGWTLGAGFRPSGATPGVGFRGTFGRTESTLEHAIENDHYLSVTVEADDSGADGSGGDAVLDLTAAEFAFSILRDTFHAARRYVVMSSVDGFEGSEILFDSGRFTTETVTDFSFTLPADDFATTDPIEFRIYGFEGQYGNKDARLAAFTLRGSVEMVDPSGDSSGASTAMVPTDWQVKSTVLNDDRTTTAADRLFAEWPAVEALDRSVISTPSPRQSITQRRPVSPLRGNLLFAAGRDGSPEIEVDLVGRELGGTVGH